VERSRLARQRLMNGYTQERLAERLEVDVSSIRRWERGQAVPHARVRTRLAAELHLSLEGLDTILAGGHQTGPSIGRLGGSVSLDSSTVAVGDEDVDRRQFLMGTGALLALSALPAGMSAAGERAHQADVVDHLRREWHTLVAADNHFGPAHAIHGVRTNLKMAGDALGKARGVDQQRILRLAAQYAESAAWLYEDLGDAAGASTWLQTAAVWAERAEHRDLSTWALVGRARQAILRHDAEMGLVLADKAIDATPASMPAIQAAALCYKAEALALKGDERLCQSALDRAERAASVVEVDPGADSTGGYASWCTLAYVSAQRGRCWQALSRPLRAIPLYADNLAAIPASYHRDRGWVLASLALAHARSQEPEQASMVAREAMSIAWETGSQRTATEVARVLDQLAIIGYTPKWSYQAEPP